MSIEATLQKISKYEIPHPNTSCDEIAEDLVRLGGKGSVLYFRRKDKKEFNVGEDFNGKSVNLKLINNQCTKRKYVYHAVYLLDNYVVDLRLFSNPVELSVYKQMVTELNKGHEFEYSNIRYRDI